MAKAGIVWTKDTLQPGLIAFPVELNAKLGIFMEYQSPQVQDFMRNNAPWTDRTSNARNGLFAKPGEDGATHSIVCYHTVPYGIFLEVRNSGQFSIISPTIVSEGHRIMQALNKFLSKVA